MMNEVIYEIMSKENITKEQLFLLQKELSFINEYIEDLEDSKKPTLLSAAIATFLGVPIIYNIPLMIMPNLQSTSENAMFGALLNAVIGTVGITLLLKNVYEKEQENLLDYAFEIENKIISELNESNVRSFIEENIRQIKRGR